MNRRNFFIPGVPRLRSVDLSLLKSGGVQNVAVAHARRSSTGLDPYAGAWTYKEAAHLLRRCMIGPTEQEIRTAVTDGMAATLTKLFTPFVPPADLISAWIDQEPQIRPEVAPPSPEYDAWQQTIFEHNDQIVKWWLKTIATGPVSIQERLTLFWHNHFVSELQVVSFAEYMHTQNELLRQNALGNFKQFTKDVTKDVAMLIYLDGYKNYKSGGRNNINENYARELQELFTMGVVDWDGNPNYTEMDVAESARALSGYIISPSTKGTLYSGLTSLFFAGRWDSGQKTFLGKTGNFNADDIVDTIFSERAQSVSRYVCEKLYRAFVYDIPDRVVIDDMATTFRNSNWEIKPVLAQLLTSEHFYDETNIGAMYKGPINYIVGLIRGMNLQNIIDFTPATGRMSSDLIGRLDSLGQLDFSPPNVKGWPEGRTWVSTSTLPARQKFTIDVANQALKNRQGIPTFSFDPIAFARTFPEPDSISKLAADMAQYFLNTQPSAHEAQVLYDTLLDGGKSYEWKLDDPDQKPDVRIRKFLAALVQLAKFQLY